MKHKEIFKKQKVILVKQKEIQKQIKQLRKFQSVEQKEIQETEHKKSHKENVTAWSCLMITVRNT